MYEGNEKCLQHFWFVNLKGKGQQAYIYWYINKFYKNTEALNDDSKEDGLDGSTEKTK
jgi:hypothetical protein